MRISSFIFYYCFSFVCLSKLYLTPQLYMAIFARQNVLQGGAVSPGDLSRASHLKRTETPARAQSLCTAGVFGVWF